MSSTEIDPKLLQHNLEKSIREKLSTIIDPDLNQDIVTLGFIKTLDITPDDSNEDSNAKFKVYLKLELTTPACPVKDMFRSEAEKIIKSFSQITDVEVSLEAKERPAKNRESGLGTVKHLIAISSCKGGVGKSTVSAWVASELALQGYKVGLLDLDIFGPSLPTLFELRLNGVPAKNQLLQPYVHIFGSDVFDQSSAPQQKNIPNIKLMSFGFLLGDSPAIMRGPMVSNYIQQLLHQVDWGELDYLFIDMPPGTGDTQLALSQTVKLDGAVIVTTPQSLSLVDVARGIIMFEKVRVPILGLVENMSYFICDRCSHKHYPFSNYNHEQGSTTLQERFGIPLLAELPIMPPSSFRFNDYKKNNTVSKVVENLIRQIGKRTLEKILIPTISEADKKIVLDFGNKTIKIGYRDLRIHCGCALCVDEFTGESKLKVESVPEDIHPVSIEPLGNYALSVVWSDRHSSGIYPYKMMLELGEAEELPE